jgi:predicted nucleotidyltransferase
MQPTPYSDLNEVLRKLVESVQGALGAKFVGAYLQGSFAVGDFDEHSDVDFVIVIEDKLSEQEVAALQSIHRRIYALESAWAQHLEGSYFPRHVLRQPPDGRLLWYLNNGSRELIQSDHCNTLLVRWVVREQGVTLAGPPPATLVDAITVTALRREIYATMRDWGAYILAHPDEYNNRFYQTYLVLNYCRMLHDLRNGEPGSKRAGANWAKATLDPSWRGLIDRTWAGRPKPEISVRQPADPVDFQATLEFLRCIIAEATSYARANDLE